MDDPAVGYYGMGWLALRRAGDISSGQPTTNLHSAVLGYFIAYRSFVLWRGRGGGLDGGFGGPNSMAVCVYYRYTAEQFPYEQHDVGVLYS